MTKQPVVLEAGIVKGMTSVVKAARPHGLTVAEGEQWKEKCLLGSENVQEPTARRRGVDDLHFEPVDSRRVGIRSLMDRDEQRKQTGKVQSLECKAIYDDLGSH